GLTVKELVNRLLNAKQTLVDSGKLSPRTWTDYKDACYEVVSAFGKSRLVADLDPDDFARSELEQRWRGGALSAEAHQQALARWQERYGPAATARPTVGPLHPGRRRRAGSRRPSPRRPR